MTYDLEDVSGKGIGRSTAIKYINSAKSLLEKIQSETIKKESKVKEKVKEDDKLKQEPIEKVEKPSIDDKKISELKKLIKTQAECNIGLVGHVDHGINETIRLIP